MFPIATIAGSAIQSIFSSGSSTNTNSVASLNNAIPTDSNQLSPFAQIVSTLQQLEQSNPAQYAQVTKQISTNLQNAAQTAQSGGNTTQANELNQLATDFTNASTSGQLPNLQDLAKAIGGHHHHNSGSQFLSALQASATENSQTNPLSIIQSTLSGAGITLSGS